MTTRMTTPVTKVIWKTPTLLSLLILFLLAPIEIHCMMNSLRVRLVSYNVLSSHLASTYQFPTLNPSHLEASNRLPEVIKKLDREVQKNSIICLQEVSQDWAGNFYSYFFQNNYHSVFQGYGKRFNGYMGCMIAWPSDSIKVLDVDISRLSDKREGGWPVAPKPGFVGKFKRILSTFREPFEKLGWLSRPAIDHWTMSENRFNILTSVKLEDKNSGKIFFVSNYHMPCAFYAPMVMSIHSEMAAKHIQNLAGSSPYILAGDWNIKPFDSSYQILTTGTMDIGHPNWPTPKYGMEWKPTNKPMRSAYADFGGEPDFTNYARVKYQEPFIDTLDYM